MVIFYCHVSSLGGCIPKHQLRSPQQCCNNKPTCPSNNKDLETSEILQLSSHPIIRKLKSKKASRRKICSKSPFPRCSCSSKNLPHCTSSSNVPDPNMEGFSLRMWNLLVQTTCRAHCSEGGGFGDFNITIHRKDLWHV